MRTICVAGKNNIAVEVMAFLVKKYRRDYSLLGICNKTDIGIDSFQLSYKKYLMQNNIKEVTLESVYDIDDLIFLSLEFDKLIKTERFKSKELFNVHFSLLPKYRGMYTAAWVILNNEKETGVTLHKIDNGIDTGDIIDQISYNIKSNMTCKDIYLNNIQYGIQIIIKNFNSILNKKYKVTKQDDSLATYYDKNSIDYNNIQIMLNEPKEIIDRKIRAYTFEDYQYPFYTKDRILFKKV